MPCKGTTTTWILAECLLPYKAVTTCNETRMDLSRTLNSEIWNEDKARRLDTDSFNPPTSSLLLPPLSLVYPPEAQEEEERVMMNMSMNMSTSTNMNTQTRRKGAFLGPDLAANLTLDNLNPDKCIRRGVMMLRWFLWTGEGT